jgi:hypothetical protein
MAVMAAIIRVRLGASWTPSQKPERPHFSIAHLPASEIVQKLVYDSHCRKKRITDGKIHKSIRRSLAFRRLVRRARVEK